MSPRSDERWADLLRVARCATPHPVTVTSETDDGEPLAWFEVQGLDPGDGDAECRRVTEVLSDWCHDHAARIAFVVFPARPAAAPAAPSPAAHRA